MGNRSLESLLKTAEESRQTHQTDPQWKSTRSGQTDRRKLHWKIPLPSCRHLLQGQERWHQVGSDQTHGRNHDSPQWEQTIDPNRSLRVISERSEEVAHSRVHQQATRTDTADLQTTHHLRVRRSYSPQILFRHSQYCARRGSSQGGWLHWKTQFRRRTDDRSDRVSESLRNFSQIHPTSRVPLFRCRFLIMSEKLMNNK